MNFNKRIGLALSGGGYRAAAFHIGTLKKLHELGVLDKIDVMSTISGGSIIGAYYCIYDKDFESFEKEIITLLNTKSVIKHILKSLTFWIFIGFIVSYFTVSIVLWLKISPWLFIVSLLIFFWLLGKYQFRIFPISKEIEKAYNKFFYHRASLADLKANPELAIGSTNLQTCRPFTFSKRKMEDSTYAYMSPPIKFKNEKFPLAKAVAASTCVPQYFSPINIDQEFFAEAGDYGKIKPVLIDGGIYDNQGIQKLTQAKSSYECDIIIASDAGNKLPFEGDYNNNYTLLIRTSEAFMGRIKNFQMAQNIYNKNGREKQIAYLSLGWDLESCLPGFIKNLKDGNVPQSVIKAHNIPDAYLNNIDLYKDQILQLLSKNINYQQVFDNQSDENEIRVARSVTTNLTTLSRVKIDALMKHAGNLTELQVKLYCPWLFL